MGLCLNASKAEARLDRNLGKFLFDRTVEQSYHPWDPFKKSEEVIWRTVPPKVLCRVRLSIAVTVIQYR